jgi:hypothetical protein
VDSKAKHNFRIRLTLVKCFVDIYAFSVNTLRLKETLVKG